MSTIEQVITKDAPNISARAQRGESIFSRFLKLLCSVRLGVTLLVLLGLACLTGMLIMQQNVEGFERYFLQLAPAQRLVYGKLGIFDIYHAWYFNALLALLSLNIILSSIDRFPKTWPYVSRPNITVPVRWLKDQQQNDEIEMTGSTDSVAAEITSAMKKNGWRDVRT